MQSIEKIPELIEQHVNRGLARYRVYHALMRGSLAEMIPTATFDQRLHRQLASELAVILNSGIENEREQIGTESWELMSNTGLPLNPRFAEAAERELDQVVENVGLRLSWDTQSVKNVFKKTALRAYIASQSSRLFPEELFRRAYLEVNRNFSFKQLDSRGRATGSEIVWRLMLRSHYFDLVNAVSMMDLAERGRGTGVIYAPGHRYDGHLVSLDAAKGEHPTFEDLRDEVFHPNSDALIVDAA